MCPNFGTLRLVADESPLASVACTGCSPQFIFYSTNMGSNLGVKKGQRGSPWITDGEARGQSVYDYPGLLGPCRDGVESGRIDRNNLDISQTGRRRCGCSRCWPRDDGDNRLIRRSCHLELER
jgi:hypothetical protein